MGHRDIPLDPGLQTELQGPKQSPYQLDTDLGGSVRLGLVSGWFFLGDALAVLEPSLELQHHAVEECLQRLLIIAFEDHLSVA